MYINIFVYVGEYMYDKLKVDDPNKLERFLKKLKSEGKQDLDMIRLEIELFFWMLDNYQEEHYKMYRDFIRLAKQKGEIELARKLDEIDQMGGLKGMRN